MDDDLIAVPKEEKVEAPPKKKKEEGLQWQNVKMATVTSEDLAAALRAAEIRTAEDLQRNQQKVVSILQSLYRVDLAALNKFAREG